MTMKERCRMAERVSLGLARYIPQAGIFARPAGVPAQLARSAGVRGLALGEYAVDRGEHAGSRELGALVIAEGQ